MSDQISVQSVLAALRSQVAGPVLTPADEGYAAEISGSNLAVLHAPPIAVGATTADDVRATVRIAVEAGVPLFLMNSGHAEIPPVTRGILLTTRRLDDVRVDTAARTATVGAGATWHDVLSPAAAAGLAPLCGSAPAVGVAGFLVGGGLGPLSRTFGFSSDHVRSFDVVCADGSLRTVSADRDPDLFWGLRGGKGGFGVVTAAVVGLLELPAVYGGGQYYAAADIPALLRAYQAFTDDPVPHELSTSLAVLRMPDLPALPPSLRAQTVAHLRVGYARAGENAAAEAEAILAPLRAAAGEPIFGAVGPLPYSQIGTVHNDPTQPSALATAGALLERLDPETVDAILAVAGPGVATPLSIVELRHFGGAIAGPGSPPDAVSGRDAAFGVWIASAPMPPGVDPAALAGAAAAVRRVIDALTPWATGGVQINFCGSENTAGEASRAWPTDVATALAGIRRRYDPDVVFPYAPGSVAPASP